MAGIRISSRTTFIRVARVSVVFNSLDGTGGNIFARVKVFLIVSVSEFENITETVKAALTFEALLVSCETVSHSWSLHGHAPCENFPVLWQVGLVLPSGLKRAEENGENALSLQV